VQEKSVKIVKKKMPEQNDTFVPVVPRVLWHLCCSPCGVGTYGDIFLVWQYLIVWYLAFCVDVSIYVCGDFLIFTRW